MTLDAAKPTDTALVSEIPAYIRENRAAINAVGVAGDGNVGGHALDIAGATSLTIGTELSEEGFETVVLTNSIASTLLTILGGEQGQIKMFVFQDLNTLIEDSNSKADGTFHLNEAPALGDYTPAVDDVLTVVNIGGDGAGTHGYWREVDRAASV